MKENNKVSRRAFLGTATAAAAGITILPSNTIAGLGHKAPSDKLNIAAVGIGGMGFTNLKNMETDNIVALCDVDWKYAGKVFDHFPNAKKYWIGGKCSMKWINPLMQFYVPLLTILMLALPHMPSLWVNMFIRKNL